MQNRTSAGFVIALFAGMAVTSISTTANAQGTFIKPAPPPEPVASSGSHGKKQKKLVFKSHKSGEAVRSESDAQSKATAAPSRRYPELPMDQDRIDGQVQDVVDGATIVISNHAVHFSSLTPLPRDGFNANMRKFIGSTSVTCTRANVDFDPQRNFYCNANGEDLALVSLLNGGSDTPKSGGLTSYRSTWEAREHMIANNSDPALQSFLSGTFTTDCTKNDCGREFFSRQYAEDINLWLDHRWEPLLHNLLTNPGKLDIYYFLLGSAANHFGSYKAAKLYLDKAKELKDAGSETERCIEVLPNNCDGADLGFLISDEKEHADVYAKSEF